jgi:hypothetical protein
MKLNSAGVQKKFECHNKRLLLGEQAHSKAGALTHISIVSGASIETCGSRMCAQVIIGGGVNTN